MGRTDTEELAGAAMGRIFQAEATAKGGGGAQGLEGAVESEEEAGCGRAGTQVRQKPLSSNKKPGLLHWDQVRPRRTLSRGGGWGKMADPLPVHCA